MSIPLKPERIRECAHCGLPLDRTEVWLRGRGPWHRHCYSAAIEKLAK